MSNTISLLTGIQHTRTSPQAPANVQTQTTNITQAETSSSRTRQRLPPVPPRSRPARLVRWGWSCWRIWTPPTLSKSLSMTAELRNIGARSRLANASFSEPFPAPRSRPLPTRHRSNFKSRFTRTDPAWLMTCLHSMKTFPAICCACATIGGETVRHRSEHVANRSWMPAEA